MNERNVAMGVLIRAAPTIDTATALEALLVLRETESRYFWWRAEAIAYTAMLKYAGDTARKVGDGWPGVEL